MKLISLIKRIFHPTAKKNVKVETALKFLQLNSDYKTLNDWRNNEPLDYTNHFRLGSLSEVCNEYGFELDDINHPTYRLTHSLALTKAAMIKFTNDCYNRYYKIPYLQEYVTKRIEWIKKLMPAQVAAKIKSFEKSTESIIVEYKSAINKAYRTVDRRNFISFQITEEGIKLREHQNHFWENSRYPTEALGGKPEYGNIYQRNFDHEPNTLLFMFDKLIDKKHWYFLMLFTRTESEYLRQELLALKKLNFSKRAYKARHIQQQGWIKMVKPKMKRNSTNRY